MFDAKKVTVPLKSVFSDLKHFLKRFCCSNKTLKCFSSNLNRFWSDLCCFLARKNSLEMCQTETMKRLAPGSLFKLRQ